MSEEKKELHDIATDINNSMFSIAYAVKDLKTDDAIIAITAVQMMLNNRKYEEKNPPPKYFIPKMPEGTVAVDASGNIIK